MTFPLPLPPLSTSLYAIGFVLVVVLTAVLIYLRDLRLYREDCERENRDPAAPGYEPGGDHGRRVIRTFPKPPMRVKALGVMQISDKKARADGSYRSWWTVLFSDGSYQGRYETAEEAREALRLDNAKRP